MREIIKIEKPKLTIEDYNYAFFDRISMQHLFSIGIFSPWFFYNLKPSDNPFYDDDE